MFLFAKRSERGDFMWPQAGSGSNSLTAGQLSMRREGIDRRRLERSRQPRSSGIEQRTRQLTGQRPCRARDISLRARPGK